MEPLPLDRPLLFWPLNWRFDAELRSPPAEFRRRLGAPHSVDEKGDGLGPEEFWAFRCDCGLELLVRHPRGLDLGLLAMQYDELEHALAHLGLRTDSVFHADDGKPGPKDGWAVVRQDETGNRHDICVVPVRAHAECFARLLEARAHKQSYYVEQRGTPPPLAQPRPSRGWAVIRQDEHGNREEMGVFRTEGTARQFATSYESEPRHKQSYFVEPVTPKS